MKKNLRKLKSSLTCHLGEWTGPENERWGSLPPWKIPSGHLK